MEPRRRVVRPPTTRPPPRSPPPCVSCRSAERRAEHNLAHPAQPPPLAATGYGYAEFLAYLRDAKTLCAEHGLDLQTLGMTPNRAVMLGLQGRDAEIAHWQELIRAMGEAGLSNIFYHLMPAGVIRSADAIGRGGARYSTFKYEDWLAEKQDLGITPIDSASMWANLEYFLTRVVPVAEAAGVRLALHPEDPPVRSCMQLGSG